MKVNNVQNHNHTSFGIKYVNKNAWNKDVLAAFEKSNVLKEINETYPKAKVKIAKLSGEEDPANSEEIHTLVMDIQLAKEKFFRWHLSSHTEKVPEKHLIKDLETLTMNDVEQRSAARLSPIMSVEVFVTKQNPIKAFFKRIFS